MRELIAIEYAKLKKFHALKIIFGVYMLTVPGWMYFMNLFSNGTGIQSAYCK